MSHSHVLERLASDLKMAGRALGTRQQYLASLRRFEERIGKSTDQATQEEVRGWVEFLQTQPIGPERLRCHYSALSFLFKKTLGRPEVVAFISMPRKDAPLPVILTPQEVKRVLESFTVAKYGIFFSLNLCDGPADQRGPPPGDPGHRRPARRDPRPACQGGRSAHGYAQPEATGPVAELLEVRPAHTAPAVLHPERSTPLPGHGAPGSAVCLGHGRDRKDRHSALSAPQLRHFAPGKPD